MAEHLTTNGNSKEEKYATLLPQLKSLIEAEDDVIANMANVAACIMETFHFLVGGLLSSYRQHIGARSFPRSSGLYSHQTRERGLRNCLGQSPNDCRRRCGTIFRTHRLQQCFTFGNRSAYLRPRQQCCCRIGY